MTLRGFRVCCRVRDLPRSPRRSGTGPSRHRENAEDAAAADGVAGGIAGGDHLRRVPKAWAGREILAERRETGVSAAATSGWSQPPAPSLS
jgi:hypothetical protein